MRAQLTEAGPAGPAGPARIRLAHEEDCPARVSPKMNGVFRKNSSTKRVRGQICSKLFQLLQTL